MEVIIGFFVLIAFLIVLSITFIPVIIAVTRKHNDTILIFLLVFFFGWTVIGWIIALIWSLSSTISVLPNNKQPPHQSLSDKLYELSSLLNKKLITQEEHDEQKKKILESK